MQNRDMIGLIESKLEKQYFSARFQLGAHEPSAKWASVPCSDWSDNVLPKGVSAGKQGLSLFVASDKVGRATDGDWSMFMLDNKVEEDRICFISPE